MGYAGDIMHDMALKELRRHYPMSEGWSVAGEPKKFGENEIYLLYRRGMRSQSATVGISFDRVFAPGFIDMLIGAGPGAAKPSSITGLIVPQGVDTSHLPGGIRVGFMRAFRYEGYDLLWLKKPVAAVASAAAFRAR